MIFSQFRFKKNLSSFSQAIATRYSERFWLLGISLAAIVLFTFNLGGVPLRDWDEGIVASVAREMYRSTVDSNTWLYPTLNEQPYLNKPPLIHWLIALSYYCFGVNEWSTRLPTAMLTAVSVLLVYAVGKEIFAQHLAAVFSSLVYLTLLPVVRHGRLAMLDGAIVCFSLLAIWSILRSRHNLRALWGLSLGLGLICLTKGLMMACLFGAIALLFLLWDNPRLLANKYFWWAIVLGLIPPLAWYGCQYLHYGEQFTQTNLIDQTFSRIWSSVENHQDPIWYYLLEIIKYAHPWLLFLPGGIILAIRNYHASWAKLTLTWSGVYLSAISLMATKLPWYVIPIYPALSWLIGANLAKIWQYSSSCYSPVRKFFLGLLALISWGGSIFLIFWAADTDRYLQIAVVIIAIAFTIATILLVKQSRYFMVILLVGLYISFLWFFNSQYWVWELGEAYPVKPVAAMIKQTTTAKQVVFTSYPYHRPSLNFYSDRIIIPLSTQKLQQHWLEEKNIYFLIKSDAIDKLNLKSQQVVDEAEGWQLIKKEN